MSANEHDVHAPESHGLHLALLLVGGLCLGFGVINLIQSFGWTGGDINSNFALVGFRGFEEVGLLPASTYSLGLVAVGAVCLIVANATAWKQTDGY